MKYKKKIFDSFEVRKSKKEKTVFINWVLEEFKGKNITIEKGYFGCRNIIFGDVDKAKVVYTAHYDTCANMFIPNFCTPKSLLIYCLYQVALLVVLLGIPSLLMGIFMIMLPNNPEISSLAFMVSYLLIFGLLLFGPANKHTANDNTSGVVAILEMVNKLPDSLQDKVAFVLFDLEEAGLIGSMSFYEKHKKVMKKKLLINLDCISDGKDILFIFNKKAREYADLIRDNYVSNKEVFTETVIKGGIYPSDQLNFPCGVGVCSVLKSDKYNIQYIDKIHTVKDVVFRDENIDYLVEKSIKLISNLDEK